ncbi:helix-turn-helix domain-containing protein [Streptomyces sp. DH12]|uniref:helix-turn-helix domain-containing protein n=1 Tax=Streptomyces sp. DH12 TaxID=2857010 RepID=UPI001E29A4E5|nr:helix-turn-helix domain-containing protein [Streptomyces sp. DH12]
MLRLTLNLPTTHDAADLADTLLRAATRAERRDPEQAALWRSLADDLSDALDALTREPSPDPDKTRKPQVQRPRDPEIDELAVERVVRGYAPYPVLTRQEALEACRRMTEAGLSSRVIAERTGVVRRTVHRWRDEDRHTA